ncbi:MAG: HIT family protein [Nitrospirota bacterium]|nr:HIT family protein [Nitrospirota bacterium]MDH5773586.1 HIT family protein [Nitrospirota bacterium]
MNATMQKFGFPDTCVKEFHHWVVVLRPQQVTLGSLVLICREDATAFSRISSEAFGELPNVLREMETSLSRAFAYNKINYLMLMMVDPEVHFHVFPRYDTPRTFAQQQFLDQGWPGPPILKNPNEIPPKVRHEILSHLQKLWSA